jgi:putative ribosome biogenesis GTPase RsgA
MNYSSDSLVRARVCEAAQEHYCLRFEDGKECDAVPAGALRWSAELPAVGDWVRARRADATLALIENVEPRTNSISRQRPAAVGSRCWQQMST